MKSLLSILALGIFLCLPQTGFALHQKVKLISTIGPVSSGLVEVLAKEFEKDTGIEVVFQGYGTGKALEMAKEGHADIVLVHARNLEDKFIEEGFGMDRRELMFNDYVILGPKNDPAGIKGLTDVREALKKIADKQAPFVTRGDRSGTHMAELKLWKEANIDVSTKPAWYELCPVGDKGNGPTAKYASEKQAYVVVERATWLAVKNDVNLDLLMDGDPKMKNFMSVIIVSPKNFPNAAAEWGWELNVEGAKKLSDWLVSDKAQTIIRDFGKDKHGEPMFFPNSDQWNAKNKTN